MYALALALLVACAPKTGLEAVTDGAVLQRRAPPEDDLVYFVMVDRFADGSPDTLPTDPADPHGWHGGDLQGVIDHLDHLQALGVRTVWLSPIFEARDEPFAGWGAFHGYWVDDPAALDPRFGTEAELRALGEALHARDMRLVLDMVFNHTGWDSPLRTEHPDWFHPDRPIEDWHDPEQVVSGWVHGLPDLDQDNPEVYAYLQARAFQWADAGVVDGFRIDAVRHMPMGFHARLNEDLDARYGDFWTLGEDFEGNAESLAGTLEAGGFDALFDFPLRYAMVDVFCKGAAPGRLASILSLDRVYGDPGKLVTFLDNHDTPRIMSECGGQVALVRQALAFQFAMRGTPALTWGTEAGLEGVEEPHNRGSMPWAQLTHGTPWPLAALRRDNPALHHGEDVLLQLDDQGLAMVRLTDAQAVLIALNTGETPWALALPEGLDSSEATPLLDLRGPPPLIGPPPPPLSSRTHVGPRSLVLHSYAIDAETAAALRALDEGAPLSLRLAATGAPVSEGDRLVAVGAGPELGSWKPLQGVPLTLDTEGVHRAELALPQGSAVALKLAVLHPDGAISWEPGPDLTALLRGRAAALELSWGSRLATTSLVAFEGPDGRWGYQDGAGAEVLSPRYLMAGDFGAGGLAEVADDQGWPLIDPTGRVVVRPFVYDNGADPFMEGLARFEQGGRLGFVDESGRVAIAPRWVFVDQFHEGRARFCQGCRLEAAGEHTAIVGGTWGYIDRGGAPVIPAGFDEAGDFEDGAAHVRRGGQRGRIDRDGRWLSDPAP